MKRCPYCAEEIQDDAIKCKHCREVFLTRATSVQRKTSRTWLVGALLLILLVLAIPIIDNTRCKTACMKRVKSPYPEIACRYECPLPWESRQ
jgi:predicted nucleic acid-binding Zn ribbon protein